MANKTPWSENQVINEATPIYVYSTADLALFVNKTVSASSKHIDLKYHYVKAALSSRIIVLRDVAPKDNPTGLLTKVVSFPTLKYLCEIIKLCDRTNGTLFDYEPILVITCRYVFEFI